MDFRGKRRSDETHRSAADPDARLAKKGKGKEARLCFDTHVLMAESRWIGGGRASHSSRQRIGTGCRVGDAGGGSRPAADHRWAIRGRDTRGFIKGCSNLNVTPHVAQKRRSAIDRRTTRRMGIAAASGSENGWMRYSATVIPAKARI